jgi:hypothetical protein
MSPPPARSTPARVRKRTEIQSAIRHSDLVEIIASHRKVGESSRMYQAIEEVGDNLADMLGKRCAVVGHYYDVAGVKDGRVSCNLDADRYRQRLRALASSAPPGASEIYAEIDRAFDENRFWASNGRHLECSKWMANRQLGLYSSPAFGRLDYFLVLPATHNYWSIVARSELGARDDVAGLLCFPAHRIKHTFSEGGDASEYLSFHPNEPTLVAFTFLEFPHLGNYSTSSPGEYLRQLINDLLGYQEEGSAPESPGFWSGIEDAREKMRLEVFITFSTRYPVVLKSEHTSVRSLYQFHRNLNDRTSAAVAASRRLRDWHTLLGCWSPIPLDDEKKGISNEGTEQPLAFNMLIRNSPTAPDTRIEQIKSVLCGVVSTEILEKDARASYFFRGKSQMAQWHHVLNVVPKDILELIRTLMFINNEFDDVERTALIPLMPTKF